MLSNLWKEGNARNAPPGRGKKKWPTSKDNKYIYYYYSTTTIKQEVWADLVNQV